MAELLYNPLDPSFRADPYPAYARLRQQDPYPDYRRLREQDPVHETPSGAFVLSRYADCVALLKDPRASSDPACSDSYQRARERGALRADEALGRAPPFLLKDPPDHTRLRGLVSRAFTPKVVEGHRPRIEALVAGLLDRVAERGSADIIADVAYPLPVTVICELLGVPAADHETFKQWSGDLARAADPEATLSPEEIEARKRAGNAFSEYFRSLVAERRKRPGDDLLSALIAAEEAGDTLSEEELISNCIFLLAAGHETTANLIGNGTLALLRNPDQLERLRADPSLARSAVEEFLRYDAPVQIAGRIARDDIEISGRVIPKGRQIAVLLASANRDHERFHDPDGLDVARADNHHLAFGHGIHFCLGAPLARLEGEVYFQALVRRFDQVALAQDELEYKPNIVNRGLKALPVVLQPARISR